MSHGRYTPPSADLQTDADHSLGSGDLDFGRCLSEAWDDTWANVGLWLGVFLVWMVAFVLSIFTVVGIFLLVPVLTWGMYRFFLGMRDGDAVFGDAFSGFSRYGEALGSMLLFFLISILISMPSQVLSQMGSSWEQPLLQIAGGLLSVAVTFLVSPRLMFAPLLIVDRGLPAAEAVTLSWQSSERVKWKLIGVFVMGWIVMLAGFIVFVVGVFPASVMAYLMVVSAYRQVVGGAPQHA